MSSEVPGVPEPSIPPASIPDEPDPAVARDIADAPDTDTSADGGDPDGGDPDGDSFPDDAVGPEGEPLSDVDGEPDDDPDPDDADDFDFEAAEYQPRHLRSRWALLRGTRLVPLVVAIVVLAGLLSVGLTVLHRPQAGTAAGPEPTRVPVTDPASTVAGATPGSTPSEATPSPSGTPSHRPASPSASSSASVSPTVSISPSASPSTPPPPPPPPPPPVPVRYEAENATLSPGSQPASDHSGFSGTGFVDYLNTTGSYVQWSVASASSRSVTLTFRYANGSRDFRPLDVTVNGTVVAHFSCFSTNDWSNWQTATATVTLSVGTNLIRATATGPDGGPNVDYLEVL